MDHPRITLLTCGDWGMLASITMLHGRVRTKVGDPYALILLAWGPTCFECQSAYPRQESKHIPSYPRAGLPTLTLHLATAAKCLGVQGGKEWWRALIVPEGSAAAWFLGRPSVPDIISDLLVLSFFRALQPLLLKRKHIRHMRLWVQGWQIQNTWKTAWRFSFQRHRKQQLHPARWRLQFQMASLIPDFKCISEHDLMSNWCFFLIPSH